MREFEKDCFVEEPETPHETEHSVVLEQVTV